MSLAHPIKRLHQGYEVGRMKAVCFGFPQWALSNPIASKLLPGSLAIRQYSAQGLPTPSAPPSANGPTRFRIN